MKMHKWFSESLQEVATGQRDALKVDDIKSPCGPEFFWECTPFQAIHDATDNWDDSRWFAGLMLMQSAIDHPERFFAYKAEDESATVYFRDNRLL